ncbi:hypothetical protein SMICM304S_03681 [Streptomyces microflavus]
MNITTEFPYETTREDVYIPLPGGTRLYARIWRPLTDEPVPALLEYLPYRLGDWTAPRDWQRHPWYAGHGYASSTGSTSGATATSEGLAGRRVRRPGAERRGRRHPLAGPAGVVLGPGRDVRHLLGRLQLAPDRRARPRAAEGDRHRRARPTTATTTTSTTWAARSSPSTCTPGPPPCSPSSPARRTRRRQATTGRSCLPPAGPVAGRRRLEGAVAEAAGGDRTLQSHLAGPPEPRRLLASTAASARTTGRSRRTCWRWAAGTTRTATPSCAWSSTSIRGRCAGSSARGRTSTRTGGCRRLPRPRRHRRGPPGTDAVRPGGQRKAPDRTRRPSGPR